MDEIELLFYQGRYSQVLAKTYDDQNRINLDHTPFIIGSLGFLGRTEEAQAFFTAKEPQLKSVQKAYGHFFLSLSWTRKSQYKKAKKHLKLNQLIDQSEDFKNQEIRFLVTQGISFFLYYFGEFQKSLTFSQKSLKASMAIDNAWMKALSLDLLANNLIQSGRILEGLSHFNQAIKFAKVLKNDALSKAMENSHLIFRCEYGIDIAESFAELKQRFENDAAMDSFSKANLGLELARQYTLRGEFKMALTILDLISGLVYQSQNRRQEVRLNLRWAEIYFQRNELSTAIHFIRSAKKSLEHVDQTYEIQLLDLEIKLLEKQGQPNPELESKLTALSQKFKTLSNQNRLQRKNKNLPLVLENLGDEIHELLMKAENSEQQARKIILQTGFYSWIYRFFPVQRGQNYILLNFESKSITCLDINSISHKASELSSLNYKIITSLSQGFKTKEQLLESVWGYKYDPLRHDSIIYSAFSSLRKILGDHSDFLQTSETGYGLRAEVLEMTMTAKSNAIKSPQIATDEPKTSFAKTSVDDQMQTYLKQGLNARQIQIMQYLQENQFISVKLVQELFEVSEITANRDLRYLNNNQFVLRVGRGRAIRYMKGSI